MESKRRFIIKHQNGTPVNLWYEPVKSIASAARFPTQEDAETFLTGIHKPKEPTYIVQEIEITYRELENNGGHEETTRTV